MICFLISNKHIKDVVKHSSRISLKYPLPRIHFQTLSQSRMMQIAIMVSRKAIVCFFMIQKHLRRRCPTALPLAQVFQTNHLSTLLKSFLQFEFSEDYILLQLVFVLHFGE